MDGPTVTLVVTGWSAGTGSANFSKLVRDAGYCQWSDSENARAGSVPGAERTYEGTTTNADLGLAHVAVQVGDLIGAVTVQDRHGSEAALVTARRLAAVTAEDLAHMDTTPR